jgi:hypothetical protein
MEKSPADMSANTELVERLQQVITTEIAAIVARIEVDLAPLAAQAEKAA